MRGGREGERGRGREGGNGERLCGQTVKLDKISGPAAIVHVCVGASHWRWMPQCGIKHTVSVYAVERQIKYCHQHDLVLSLQHTPPSLAHRHIQYSIIICGVGMSSLPLNKSVQHSSLTHTARQEHFVL